jgi:hypothetical protein
MNNWDDRAGMKKDEVTRFMQLTALATVPSIPPYLFARANNEFMLPIEAYLKDPKRYAEFEPLAVQLVSLANFLLSGFKTTVIEQNEVLATALGAKQGGRRKKEVDESGGLFGMLKKG